MTGRAAYFRTQTIVCCTCRIDPHCLASLRHLADRLKGNRWVGWSWWMISDSESDRHARKLARTTTRKQDAIDALRQALIDSRRRR